MKKRKYRIGPRTKLKAALIVEKIDAEAAGVDVAHTDPADFLQSVLDGKHKVDVKIEAAKVLMPYRHKKKPVDINTTTNTPTVVEMHIVGPKR